MPAGLSILDGRGLKTMFGELTVWGKVKAALALELGARALTIVVDVDDGGDV